MRRIGFADIVGHNTMLKAYLSKNSLAEADRLVKEMAGLGLKPNKVTYNELLHAKVTARDRQGVWSLVGEMQAAGVKANSVTCSILLKSLSVNSHSNDVRRVIDIIDSVEESIDEVL